jgi:hypothetical protein
MAGCHVVEAKAWNLSELHDESTRHRYTGALEGDIEYVFRHQIAGSLAIGGASFENKAPGPIEDPSRVCLENLIELEAFGAGDPRVAALQVEWFSRIAVEDPWVLSRERAVLGLAQAAERLNAGVPAGLPKGTKTAGAEAGSEALAGLVRAAGPVIAGRVTATERLDLESACRIVSDLVLVLDGARRLLLATASLGNAAGRSNNAARPLLELAEELQRRCVRLALAAALLDRDPRVRAAAVEAAVASAGLSVLQGILAQLDRESAPEVLLRVLELVRRRGLPPTLPENLPASAPGTPPITPEMVREAQLRALIELLDRPETSVRVGAMRALAVVADANISSLREEDWQSWWLSRRERRAAGPTP